jgi:hypothetical protein
MSNDERYEIAKVYVDKQLKKMEKNGLKVKKVSQREYKEMIRQVAQNVNYSRDSKRAAIS